MSSLTNILISVMLPKNMAAQNQNHHGHQSGEGVTGSAVEARRGGRRGTVFQESTLGEGGDGHGHGGGCGDGGGGHGGDRNSLGESMRNVTAGLRGGMVRLLVALVLFGDIPKWSGQGYFEDTSGTRQGRVRDMSGRGKKFRQVWERT